MAKYSTPHFHNQPGVAQVRIGAKEFMCVGALPPFDHPHIFIDMGNNNDAICPYCSTHYVYDAIVDGGYEPPECVFEPRARTEAERSPEHASAESGSTSSALIAMIEKARFDLIVRFVAVVISVGFATRFSQMEWLKNGSLPTSVELQELLRLSTALFLIISAWEGWHLAVSSRPLKKWPRFFVSVVVTVLTLVFLLSANSELLWLLSLALINFVLYVIWEVISIQEFRGKYLPENGGVIAVYLYAICCEKNAPQQGRQGNIGETSRDSRRVARGSASRLFWFLYFFTIIFVTLAWSIGGLLSAILSCLFILFGAVQLRIDAGNFTVAKRLVWILSVITVYLVILAIAKSVPSIESPEMTPTDHLLFTARAFQNHRSNHVPTPGRSRFGAGNPRRSPQHLL